MAYQLISFVLCPFVQRSVIVLNEKQLPFEITYIDLQNPPEGFSAISPLGKVPVLRIDQARILFESAVISEYLDEAHPPPLHPADPWRRAHNRAWIEFGSSLMSRQYRLLMAADETEVAQELRDLRQELHHLEAQLGDGPYFNGTAFSLVDTAYAPLWLRFAILEQKFPQHLLAQTPKLQSWSAALLERPSVQQSVVADFATQFCQYYAAEGGWLGKHLI